MKVIRIDPTDDGFAVVVGGDPQEVLDIWSTVAEPVALHVSQGGLLARLGALRRRLWA